MNMYIHQTIAQKLGNMYCTQINEYECWLRDSQRVELFEQCS
uniref:Uncharacterized protein n=1 Tax=Arundo donax TaxID=35708 RepID=A0A0A9DVP8_ARUDO